MRVDIPKELIVIAQEFSQFKTPKRRTAGFQEQAGQVRGIGDLLDTIGSFMLTRFLADKEIPCKMQLAVWQGDDYDLEVNVSNRQTINIKTSSWQPVIDDFEKTSYHMPIKQSEFSKLSDYFIQIMVHLNPPVGNPHVHFCGWVPIKELSIPLTENKYYRDLPHTGGSMGLWIPSKDLHPFREFTNGIN